MEAYQRFNKVVFGWEKESLRLIRHDFFVDKFKINHFSLLLYTVTFGCLISGLNTYYHYDKFIKVFVGIFFLVGIPVYDLSFPFLLTIKLDESAVFCRL